MSHDEERPAPRRLGNKGTLQSLSAAEYMAKRGVSLFVALGNAQGALRSTHNDEQESVPDPASSRRERSS